MGRPAVYSGMLRKIEHVRQIIDKAGLPVEIEVDGGITSDNSRCVIEKGADILVSGAMSSPVRTWPRPLANSEDAQLPPTEYTGVRSNGIEGMRGVFE